MPTTDNEHKTPKQKPTPNLKYNLYHNGLPAVAAGFVDIAVFQPIDRWITRIQSKQPAPTTPTPFSEMYNGALAVSAAKTTQRLIKYGGEPEIEAQLLHQFPQLNHSASHAIAGGITGALETVVVPIDTLIKLKQTESFSQSATPVRSYPQMISQESTHLFRALPITLSRNMLGTAGFFGTQNVVREHVLKVKEGEKLSYKEKILNSFACPAAGITASYPLDVIKTRMQVTPKAAAEQLGAFQHFTQMMKTEGVTSLYSGLGKRLMTAVPRGALSFFTVQLLTDQFNQSPDKNKTSFQLKK